MHPPRRHAWRSVWPAAGWPRPRRAACVLALLALPIALGALAQDEGTFTREALPLRQEFAAVLHHDLDGDGVQELIVVEADRDTGREVPYTVRVFQRGAQGYQPLPAEPLRLPAKLSLVGAANFRGGAGLALLQPDEVAIWPWRAGRFVPEQARRLAVSSIFTAAREDLEDSLDWLQDLDGDGVSEMLIPRFDGVEVLSQRPDGGLRRRALLGIRSRGRIFDWFQRDVVAYELPALIVQQIDGRGWRDVLLYHDGQVWAFLLDDAMDGGARAPVLADDLQPPEPFDPTQPRDPPKRLVAAMDLDLDGRLDLVLAKNDAADSQFNTRTSVLIHYGRTGPGGEPLHFAHEPDQAFFSEGFALPIVLDVNADGRGDLVLVNVEIGFWTVIKALISRSVSAEAAFHLMLPEGRYPRDPQYLQTYDVTFSLGRFSHQPIVRHGDLNGDTLPDLLLSEDKETLGIHWGRRDGVWDDDPDAVLKDFMPAATKRVLVADLDRDGRDDLLFSYNRDDIRLMPEVNHTLAVLRSRYGSPVARQAAQR